MATFPSIAPVFSLSKKSQPKIRRTAFGDGYEHRTVFGLNNNPKEWSLTFNVNNTDASTIEAFLDAQAATGASFDWTPPDSSVSYKWVCESWNKEVQAPNFNVIDMTFRQVFEP